MIILDLYNNFFFIKYYMNAKKLLNTQNLSILLGLLLVLQLSGKFDLKTLFKPKKVGGCAGTEFGCCPDQKTVRDTQDGKNCPLL